MFLKDTRDPRFVKIPVRGLALSAAALERVLVDRQPVSAGLTEKLSSVQVVQRGHCVRDA